ncbi:MAG: zinc ribbon domain-containing protein [Anaerolineales bacterium]|jgi:hypothetical protein|nr:zinc ribbon domain-containing protein [Anaerolineales bacterium]
MTKKSFLLILLLFSLFLSRPAQAQGELNLSTVEVDLWPEYDDPSMLVIYRIALASSASLPAELRLRIPAAAGSPSAVASRQPDGSLLNAAFTQSSDGQWNTLAITATSLEIQVEYYDPNLAIEGVRRNYRYEWPGDYAIQSLTIQFKQPLEASNLELSPGNFGQPLRDENNLQVYTQDFGSLPAGSPVNIELAYDRTESTPSLFLLNPTLTAPVEPAASETSDVVAWVLGGVGFALLIGGGVWYVRSRQEVDTRSTRRHRSRRTANSKNSSVPAAEGQVYCHRCGRRAASGDRFCRDCGSELRR